jgi:FkbM family methyltransferase
MDFYHKLIYHGLDLMDKNGVKSKHFVHRLFRKVLLPKPKKVEIIPTLYGFWIKIEPNGKNLLENKLYTYGTYEKGTLETIKLLMSPNGIFIDAGANIGLMTLFAATLFKNKVAVYSFEPHPTTFKILQENIALNNLENVKAFQSGLGAGTSKGKLQFIDGDRGMGTLVVQDTLSKSVEVDVISLNDFCKENLKGRSIDLVKIDVEGFEMEVLKGFDQYLSQENAPSLIVECSLSRGNFNYTPKEMFRYLKSINDYRIFNLKDGKEKVSQLMEITDEDNLPAHDNLFCILGKRCMELNLSLFEVTEN